MPWFSNKPSQKTSAGLVARVKPFSPSLSKMEKQPSAPESCQSLSQRQLIQALDQPSGFAGMTLGEGLQLYRQVAKRVAGDYLFVALSPVVIALSAFLETLALPAWLTRETRQQMGCKYPYQGLKETTLQPKEILFNRLIPLGELHHLMATLDKIECHPENTRQAFNKMVSGWVDLGWVARCSKVRQECLLITRKGYRALRQYAKTHSKAGGGHD